MTVLNNVISQRLVNYVVGGTATTGPFAIPFPFSLDSTIRVYIDGVETQNFTIAHPSLYSTEGNEVTLDTAVSNSTVTVLSDTEAKRTTGSTFVQADLSTEIDRIFAVLQEVKERGIYSLPQNDVVDVVTRRLSNIVDPVDAQDAVTKVWVETFVGQGVTDAGAAAQAAQAAAETAQAAAEQAETDAQTAETNAAASASTASSAQTGAQAAQTAAEAAQAAAEAAEWNRIPGGWVVSTAYAVNDCLENGGSSYIATSAHTSAADTEPGVGASWETVWDLVASKGDAGSSFITELNAAAGVTTANDADQFCLSVAGVLKKFTWSSMKTRMKAYMDTLYAAIGHNHDASYSATGHNHDAAYSAISHNHDAAYSAVGHNHSGTYEPVDGNILRLGTHKTLTAGIDSDAEDLGTLSGTVTLEVDDNAKENYKTATNDGAATIAAPSTSGSCAIALLITNGATAGTLTLSGFSFQSGDSLTTTNGDKFKLIVTKIGTHIAAHIEAQQ